MAGFFVARAPLLALAGLSLSLLATPDSAEAAGLSVQYGSHGDELFFAIDYRPGSRIPARRNVIIALDSSRSLAGAPFAEASALIAELAAKLAGRARVEMVYGDYRSHRCRRSVSDCLAAIEPGGSSDLRQLLDTAIARARALPGNDTILLVSDGVPTRGPRTAASLLRAATRRIAGSDIQIHVAAVGSDDDGNTGRALLRRLADDLGGLYHERPSPATLAAAVRDTILTEVSVTTVEGDVLELVGTGSDNLRANAGYVVLGKLLSGSATLRLRGRWRGRVIDRHVRLEPKARKRRRFRHAAVVERWARMAIAEIRINQPDNQALIDYIEERYLPRPVQTEAAVRTIGSFAGRKVRITCGGFGRARVWRRGDRDKNIIRQAVRARESVIRNCYERALRRDQHLAGTIKTSFWLAPDGAVHDAFLVTSELGSSAVESCVLNAVRTIRAPSVADSVNGTWEQIFYPFEFEPVASGQKTVISLAAEVASHVAAGRVDAARMIIVQRARKLAQNRLDPGGLLPLVRAPKVRAAFPGYYRHAARARLAAPDAPMGLIAELYRHTTETDPEAIPELFGRTRITTGTGALILSGLVADNRTDLSLALGRAWSNLHGPRAVYQMLRASGSKRANDDQLMYEVSGALLSMDGNRRAPMSQDIADLMNDFLASASALGADEPARTRVLDRCHTLDGQRSQCANWLERFIQHPEVRQRLTDLHRPVVEAALKDRRAHPEGNYADQDFAEALAYTGDATAAVRALSENFEANPDDPNVSFDFAVGLLRLRQTDAACEQLREDTENMAGTDARRYITEAYQDAWQRPAPGDLCR